MLRKIKTFFDTHLAPDARKTQNPEQSLHIACAALMLEVARADFEISAQEKTKIRKQLENVLKLPPTLVDELIDLAETEVEEAVSLHQFTSLIHAHYSAEEKVHILFLLWKIAYSENQLDKYEEALIRKISDLLYISHKDFIQTKQRAEQETATNKR